MIKIYKKEQAEMEIEREKVHKEEAQCWIIV
jgi:hypothetical protein